MSESPIIEYETTLFDLKPDSLGPNKATLLHARTKKQPDEMYQAVLYLHGYSDYFFHDHLCQRYLEKNFDFYALDLRKCGRSIISPEQDQYRHYCRDFHEYDEEITLAIESMIKESQGRNRKLCLLGHSTGGLITILYGNSGAKRTDIDAIILNSPYLAQANCSWIEKMLLAGLVRLSLSVDHPDVWYGRSIHKSERGEWNFDVKKKPIDKIRLHGPFISAVETAQQNIGNGQCTVQCPVLMMCSTRSIRAGKHWQDEYAEADLILDVGSMKRAATRIAKQLTIHEIEGAKHDVFLSKESVRETAFQLMFQWLINLENKLEH